MSNKRNSYFLALNKWEVVYTRDSALKIKAQLQGIADDPIISLWLNDIPIGVVKRNQLVTFRNNYTIIPIHAGFILDNIVVLEIIPESEGVYNNYSLLSLYPDALHKFENLELQVSQIDVQEAPSNQPPHIQIAINGFVYNEKRLGDEIYHDNKKIVITRLINEPKAAVQVAIFG